MADWNEKKTTPNFVEDPFLSRDVHRVKAKYDRKEDRRRQSLYCTVAYSNSFCFSLYDKDLSSICFALTMVININLVPVAARAVFRFFEFACQPEIR